MSEPDHEYLRRWEVLEWLKEPPVGIAERVTEKLIETGQIKAVHLTPKGRAHYLTSQIKRDVLNGHNDESKKAELGIKNENHPTEERK